MNEATKLKFQLSRAQKEAVEWKTKCTLKDAEFAALQGTVTAKMKQRQQTINRLEQEVIELKNVRDVLTRDYEKTLRLNIELGKSDADQKAELLSERVEQMAADISALRIDLESSRNRARDLEDEKTAEKVRSII